MKQKRGREVRQKAFGRTKSLFAHLEKTNR